MDGLSICVMEMKMGEEKKMVVNEKKKNLFYV